MNDRSFFQKREIASLGDSHALYSFGYCRNVDVYWLGPRLMHRVARDGLRSLITMEDLGFFGERHLADYQSILVSFGEIDARSHLPGIAKRFGWSLEQAATDLVSRFVATLAAQDLLPWRKVILSGVTPPSTLYLDSAQIAEQRVLRRVINAGLRAGAAQLGARYLAPPEALIGPDGALARAFDLDGVHVNYDGAALMMKTAAAMAKVAPSFEDRDIDILQMTVANRYGFN